MDLLIKDNWTKDNINDFYEELLKYKHEDKIEWTKRIINTNASVLAVLSPDIKAITKRIKKGNYISFLDIMPHKYHEATIVDAYLINTIKDVNIKRKYISKLSKYIDSWSTVDALNYNIKGQEDLYLSYAKDLIKSDEPFVRRIGSRILFAFANRSDYVDKVFDILDTFNNEEHYYVNMSNAWLLCEFMINQRDKTLNYLKNNNLNKFTINKAISKCRDSCRVSKEDKELLLKYKVK